MKSAPTEIQSIGSGDGALPSDAALAAAFAEMLGGSAYVVSRKRNVFSSAAMSEIVRFRAAESDVMALIKYEGVTRRHTGHGYWGGIEYEAGVYRDVLARVDAGTPRLYGMDREGDVAWMAIEYVEGERLSKSPRRALIVAARWLGAFHRVARSVAATTDPSGLNVMDAEYFRGWARRTKAFTKPLHETTSWLTEVCASFEEQAAMLAADPRTVVHGEFYPRNVLIAGERAVPVDWQSAAVGPGEIDLASLIEGWGHGELVGECVAEYARCRWPEGAPEEFEKRLGLARLYWPLRWLGDEEAWTRSPKRAHYFDELLAAAQLAGLSGGEARR